MEFVDKKKQETAILYLQRIADGNNPVNNMPAEKNSRKHLQQNSRMLKYNKMKNYIRSCLINKEGKVR